MNDNLIQAFLNSHPAHLAPHNESRLNRALNLSMPRLQFYRPLIVSEMLYNRMLLHRPYYPQLGEERAERQMQGTEEELVSSRQICIEAAPARVSRA